MSAHTIYNDLRRAGMTHEGACAMLGNMQCESIMHSNNLQDSYNNLFKLSDEQYTALVDAGKPTYNGKYFANDSAGYGLCQWTSPARKRNLRQFARNWGVSVGAEDMQTAFAVEELKTEYAALWEYLCKTDDLYSAAERICKEYERPAENNVDARYKAAQEFSATLAAMGATETSPDFATTAMELISDIVDKLNELKILIGG